MSRRRPRPTWPQSEPFSGGTTPEPRERQSRGLPFADSQVRFRFAIHVSFTARHSCRVFCLVNRTGQSASAGALAGPWFARLANNGSRLVRHARSPITPI